MRGVFDPGTYTLDRQDVTRLTDNERSLYYLVGGVLLPWVVGLLAVLVPARRAASISPAVATRTV